MTSKFKKVYNSKPVSIIKNICIGIGGVVILAIVVVGAIMLSPILLGVVMVVIQFAAWVLLFCVVVLLPLWCIGKLCGWGFLKRKNKAKETTVEEDIVNYQKEISDLKEAIDALKREQ